ncbi:ABC transporter permease [Bordetella hinzii]|uniref:ABC transporter permease n=2 Tax=Bordetella hinzii TaxID=103855 RepID=A0AAN1VGI7_9BORD|nr:ABC transporter permease [Bordetella hinzii]AKQ56953.1 Glutathione transport system permease protein GsiC [Bordetella hinzii]AKQ61419.1 Glutathione transport system permease protein GsiC [Bordetella hinzii]AZW17608.1 ABC transporter permease [Bordetella hinzii]KCB23885.1 putative glutathione ABC transporter, permease protein GsiC [Bordetella hinzii OH87 BAL007II]KCB30152.1 putative glutathione ABC transporter, permease protein GsiC [Bordetella hinzii L60]
MIRYAIKRLLLAIPTLLAMLTAVFILVRLVPGDPAAVMLGDQASAEALAALRLRLGLDLPTHEQYLRFLGDMLTGNFGVSMASGRTVLQEVGQVLPWTLQLTAAAILIGVVFGLPLGIWAALRRNAWPDYLGRLLSLTGLSFPAFVSAILMLLVFAIQLRWFPVIGSSAATDWGTQLRNLALPAFNLGLIMMAYVMRVTRSSMLGVMGEDYVRTARAKGLRPLRLIMRHGLRNALIPIVTVVGLYFGTLIGNSVLTEIVFNRPGLGKLILGALNTRDYTLLQGLMVVFAACVILVNLLTDLVYGLVDPRVKYK